MTTNEERAEELWDTADTLNLQYHMSCVFGEMEAAENARIAGVTACIQLADLFRLGTKLEGVSEEGRQEFMNDYPEGSTAEELIAKQEAA